MNVDRILLYAEGNFSYTLALCKKLAKELQASREEKNYEIVATDYAEHDKINEIKDNIKKVLSEMRMEHRIKVTILDKVDATRRNEQITGSFDNIFCNFPTPFGREKLDVGKMQTQIRKNNLLKKEGLLHISFWADDNGTYEYSYRLARAQKINGFRLISRKIFDRKEWEEHSYTHLTQNGEMNMIDFLPLVATYQIRGGAKNEPLGDSQYDEVSDSEELPNDAMPTRGANIHYPSSHVINRLNIGNEKIARSTWRMSFFNANRKLFSFNAILSLIQTGDYRKADRRLTVLIEAGKNRPLDVYNDLKFDPIINLISDLYEKSDIPKPTNENLTRYHQYIWYAKLKVLTGVEIPELRREYNWN